MEPEYHDENIKGGIIMENSEPIVVRRPLMDSTNLITTLAELDQSGGGPQPKRDSPTNIIKGGITVLEENSNLKKSSVTRENIIDDVNTEPHNALSSPKETKHTSDETVENITNGVTPGTPKSELNFSLLANKLNSLHISTPGSKNHLSECDESLNLSTDSLEVVAEESVFLSFDSTPVREGALSREEGKFSLAVEEEPKGNDSTLVEQETACLTDELSPTKDETQPQSIEVRKSLQFEIPTVDITGTSPQGNIHPVLNVTESPPAATDDHISKHNSVPVEDDLSSVVASLKINESVVNNTSLIEDNDKLNVSNKESPSSNTIVNNLPLTVCDNEINLSSEESPTHNSSSTTLNTSHNNSAENILKNSVNNTSFKLEGDKINSPLEDINSSSDPVDIDTKNISNSIESNSSFTVEESQIENGSNTTVFITSEDAKLNLSADCFINSKDDVESGSNTLVNNSSENIGSIEAEVKETCQKSPAENYQEGEVISLVNGKDSEQQNNISIYEIGDDTFNKDSSCYIVEDDVPNLNETKDLQKSEANPISIGTDLPNEEKVATCPSPVPVDVHLELNNSENSFIVEIPKHCIVKTPIKEQETQELQSPSSKATPLAENKTKESSSVNLDQNLREETVVEKEISLPAEVDADTITIIPTEECLVVSEENASVEVPKEQQNLTATSKEEFILHPVVQNCVKEPEETQTVVVREKEEIAIKETPIATSAQETSSFQIPTEDSPLVVPEEKNFVEVPKEEQHLDVSLKGKEFSHDLLTQNSAKEPEENQIIIVNQKEEKLIEETLIATSAQETSACQIATEDSPLVVPEGKNVAEIPKEEQHLNVSTKGKEFSHDLLTQNCAKEPEENQIIIIISQKEEKSIEETPIVASAQETSASQIPVEESSLSVVPEEKSFVEVPKEQHLDVSSKVNEVSHDLTQNFVKEESQTIAVRQEEENCADKVTQKKEICEEDKDNIVTSAKEVEPVVAFLEGTSKIHSTVSENTTKELPNSLVEKVPIQITDEKITVKETPLIAEKSPLAAKEVTSFPPVQNSVEITGESHSDLIQSSSVPVHEAVAVNKVNKKKETSQPPVEITSKVVEDLVTPTLNQELVNNSSFTAKGGISVPTADSTKGVLERKQNNIVISAKEEKSIDSLVDESCFISREEHSDFAASDLSELDLIKGVHGLGGVASNSSSYTSSSTDGFHEGTDSNDTVREISLDYNSSIREEAKRVAQDILNSSRSSSSNSSEMDQTSPVSCNQYFINEKQCMMRSAVSSEINRSEAGPVTADENFQDGESFQDGKSFDFDYLAKFGNKGKGCSKLSRQSLFVKFDPLIGQQSPNKDSAENKLSVMSESAGSDNESKITKESGTTTPKRMTKPEEKLISMTPEKIETPTQQTWTKVNANSPSTPTLKQDILSREISKLQTLMVQQEQSYQEQLTSKSEMIEKLMKRISELEAKEPRDDIENKLKTSEAMCSKLKKELSESNTSKKQLIMIMEEYEKTISQLVTKREDEKKEFEQMKENIASERDSALQHLNNLEVAFNDIHQKYERCKQVIETLKSNETLLKESLAENEKTIKKQEGDYMKLKKHASDMLEAANEELATLRKNHLGEVAKLKAIAKKFEIKVKSLEESLEQKQKEVLELTQICDELIGKVENQ